MSQNLSQTIVDTQHKSPFKFLDSYSKEDCDIYFGRDQEVEKLYNQIFYSDLLLMYGTSGTGKSSLIQCGLGNMFEDSDWLPIFIRKGDNIIASIEEALQAIARTKGQEKKPILSQIHSLYLDYYKPIYLIFDQFEELFILGDEEEENNFFWMLSELVESEMHCKCILSMREEYLACLDKFEEIIPSLFDNRFRVERMRKEQIEEVILSTVSNDRFQIELGSEDLPKKIIKYVRDENGRVDLANLQVYMDRLYKNDLIRQESQGVSRKVIFDKGLLKQTGKMDDVLSLFLEEQVDLLNLEFEEKGVGELHVPLSVLGELVTGQETKQTREVEDIVKKLGRKKNIEADLVLHCIQRLTEMRILKELV